MGIADASSPPTGSSLDVVFAPVRSQTAFEETVERLGTAIKLGLLPPGTRLPAERELCPRLGIARSTLRQALLAPARPATSRPPAAVAAGRSSPTPSRRPQPPSPGAARAWREVCDERMAVEVGVAVLAAERAPCAVARRAGRRWPSRSTTSLDDFPAYRQTDVRFHVGLAEATGNPRLVPAMTEMQGAMTGLISIIAHPRDVLASSNAQHRRLLGGPARARRGARRPAVMTEHVAAPSTFSPGCFPPG